MRMVLRIFLRTWQVECGCRHNIISWKNTCTFSWNLHSRHNIMCYIYVRYKTSRNKVSQTRMWANAQRDGRPAEYRWRPLFNAAKFGCRLLLECRAVTLPRSQTRWNLQGCPKLTKRSQPLVGRSSPYYGDMWRRYCCLTSFVPIVDTCLICEDMALQSCAMVPRWRFLVTFLRPVFAASHVQQVSDLHSKFALRPRHV